MTIRFCSGCGKEVGENDKICPNCKSVINQEKSKIAIYLVVVSIAMILVGLFFLNKSDSISKAKKYYIKGDKMSYDALLLKMDSEDKEELYAYFDKEINNVYENYDIGSLSYTKANNLIDDITLYCPANELDSYEQIVDLIERTNKSHIAFEKAVKYYDSKQYEEAFEQYCLVINEDKNFTEAEEKKTEIREWLVKEYKEKANSAYEDGKYDAALTFIEKGMRLEETSDLNDMKADIEEEIRINKEKQERDLEEKREKSLEKARLYSPGQEVLTDNFEGIYKGTEIVDKILPDNTSGYYRYYYPENDKNTYFDVAYSIKNISNHDRMIDGIIQGAVLTYDKGTKYTEYSCYYSFGKDINYAFSGDSIDPLETMTIHLVFEIPIIVADSDKSIEVEYNLDGKKQYIIYRDKER